MKKELEKTAPEPKPTGSNFAEWRWPVVILSLGFMALIAFLYSLNAAKNTTIGTAKEIRETVKEVGDAAITIAENFQQAKITETFVENLAEVSDTGEGNLMVATMKNTKTFKRTEKLTILWDSVSLGTTVTEIKVPATYRYHIRLSEPWKLEVREQAGKDRRFAANQMCGADDKCVVRVRNGGPSEERHRVVVRALMWGINDWRAASMAQAGRMVGVRRTMRRAR